MSAKIKNNSSTRLDEIGFEKEFEKELKKLKLFKVYELIGFSSSLFLLYLRVAEYPLSCGIYYNLYNSQCCL
jgi:hypothetical protein